VTALQSPQDLKLILYSTVLPGEDHIYFTARTAAAHQREHVAYGVPRTPGSYASVLEACSDRIGNLHVISARG